MDAVPVWDGEKIRVVEFRNIKAGDMIVTGRTEDASEGIYVHDDCWVREEEEEIKNTFAFRQARSRETSFTQDYKELIELLKYEKETGGYVVWVLGPACSFDAEAQKSHGRDNIQGILPGSACGKCPGYSRSGGRISWYCAGLRYRRSETTFYGAL